MKKPAALRGKAPDYQSMVLERIKKVRNGSISIIKQDDRVIQINVSDSIKVSSGDREGATTDLTDGTDGEGKPQRGKGE
jgi:hypothetical protein